MTNPETNQSEIWARLRRWTPARIGLGRAGVSLPTQALLEFELAHARARDAVHAGFDAEALAGDLRSAGFGEALVVRSQAQDRMVYLLRPDLGRRLDVESRNKLCERFPSRRIPAPPRETASRGNGGAPGIVVVVADGLSPLAAMRHAAPVLGRLRMSLGAQEIAAVVANGARVALGDEIGELLEADVVLVLIGERPGLSSPDSLGAYLTWAPRVGRTDAERNCISNIRPEGLPYAEAARRLGYLLAEARRLGLSGLELKG